MDIIKITEKDCIDKKNEIARIIYDNMNFGHSQKWYSIEEGMAKVDNLKGHIEKGTAIPFAAIVDGKIAGFVWGYPCDDRGKDGRIYISILQVNEEYRGMSIGSKLVDAVVNEAKKYEGKYHTLWLHTDGNPENKAIRFYEKIGFSKERIQFSKEV